MRSNSQPANVNITLGGSDKRQNIMLGKFSLVQFAVPAWKFELHVRKNRIAFALIAEFKSSFAVKPAFHG